jgi:DNA-binding transcriptional regulator YiaG
MKDGTMRASWREIKNRTMTKVQQARARTPAMQDFREMELRELREALKTTQVTLAKRLKTTQAAVSRLEKRPGMLVNTLGDYVEALGGRIEVRAVLPDRTVSLTQFFRKKPAAERFRKKPNTGRAGRNRAVVQP